MSVPRCKQFISKCDNEFLLCADIGEKGFVGVEHPEERRTLYQYILFGQLTFNTIDEERVKLHSSISSDRYSLLNVKEFLYKYAVVRADTDFSVVGFNTLDRNVDWDGKIVKESFVCDNDKSYLVCFDGNPIINEKELRRFDYAKLLQGKSYDIDLKDGIIGVFRKLC